MSQPRAKSCITCQKRKVKCDRTRPTCSMCVRDEWNCSWHPIATPSSRKVAPVPIMSCESHEQVWELNSKVVDPQKSRSQPIRKPKAPPSIRFLRPREALVNALVSRHPLTTLSITPPSLSLAQSVVFHLNGASNPGMNLQNLGPFFQFVPARLGHSAALDAAVQCICTIYVAVLNQNDFSDPIDRREYYHALKCLRESVSSPGEALSSNTLCAAVILSWYEILADNLDDGWLDHLRGTARLLQMRGPSRHVEGFGQALLYTQEGMIVSDALIRREASFLSSPEWQIALTSTRANNEDHLIRLAVRKTNEVITRMSSLAADLYEILLILDTDSRTKKLGDLLNQCIRLRLETKATISKGAPDHYTILLVKQAIVLLFIDTALHGLYTKVSSHADLNFVISLNLGDYAAGFQGRQLEFLKQEINETFEVIYSNLAVARKVTPFIVRKMAYMRRVMSKEMMKRGPRHETWERLDKLMETLTGSEFLVDAAARAAERRKSGGSLLSEGTGSISSPW